MDDKPSALGSRVLDAHLGGQLALNAYAGRVPSPERRRWAVRRLIEQRWRCERILEDLLAAVAGPRPAWDVTQGM
jgi:hypothetical protein